MWLECEMATLQELASCGTGTWRPTSNDRNDHAARTGDVVGPPLAPAGVPE